MDAAPLHAPGEPSSKATCVAHCWVRRPIYDELQHQAGQRREHPDAFAAKLLTAVLVLGAADELIEKAGAELQIS
jgi:hypothetical protein